MSNRSAPLNLVLLILLAGCTSPADQTDRGAPEGFTSEPPRLQNGAGAAMLIDVFAEAEPSVAGDGFRLQAKGGSLNPSAQSGVPADCTDCWVYDVGNLQTYTLRNARLSLSVADGLRVSAGTTEWTGTLTPGRTALLDVELTPDRDGVWSVPVTLRVAWADIENWTMGQPGTSPIYESTDTAYLLFDGDRLLVRSDDRWCSGGTLDEQTLECRPSAAEPVS